MQHETTQSRTFGAQHYMDIGCMRRVGEVPCQNREAASGWCKTFLLFVILGLCIGQSETIAAMSANEPPTYEEIAQSCKRQGEQISSCLLNGRLYLGLSSQLTDRPILITQYPVEYFVSYPLFAYLMVEEHEVIMVAKGRIESTTGFDIDEFGPVRDDWFWEEGESVVARFEKILSTSSDEVFFVDVADWVVDYFLQRPASRRTTRPSNGFVSDTMSFSDRVSIEVSLSQPIANSNQEALIKRVLAFVVLPQEVMAGRTYDVRMAFRHDQIKGDIEWPGKANIVRFRLEKADDQGVLSNPKKPILVYLDPRIPDEFKESARQGVLAWNRAFEAAGFADAIQVAEAPRDVNWRLFRVGNTVLTWHPQPKARIRYRDRVGGGSGSMMFDPRSGEILVAEALIRHPDTLLRDWWYTRCSAFDHRVRGLTLPTDVMRELVEQLVSHEFGHSLGLMDGHFGQHVYTIDQIRNPSWLARMGYTPSIMNYSRCNYVAQPEDKVDFRLLRQSLGPADIHQIQWGYSVFDEDDESQRLSEIVGQSATSPWLQYVPTRGSLSVGPQVYPEVVGSRDVVQASVLGLRNLERIAIRFESHISTNDNAVVEISHLYGKLIERRQSLVGHAITLIGGYLVVYEEERTVFQAIDKAEQREALRFLISELITLPEYLFVPTVNRVELPGVPEQRVYNSQLTLLRHLLSWERLSRVPMCQEKIRRNETLCFEFLVDEVLDALFSKDSGRVSPTTQRQKEYFRELQALAIQVLSEYADSEHAGQHLSAAKRSELRVALSGRGLLEQPSIH